MAKKELIMENCINQVTGNGSSPGRKLRTKYNTINAVFCNIDECVLNALKFFTKAPLPSLDFLGCKRPLVAGSGNAAITAQILFDGIDAVFADESNYIHKLNTIKTLDAAVVISASGEKDALPQVQEAKKQGFHTILLTANPSASSSKFANKVCVFPKIPEPYTYNVSTYLGMILAKTKEDPKKILMFLKSLEKKIPKNLKKYDAFCIIVPSKFELIREMFSTKFDELFGPIISARVFTFEQTKHAKTVVQSNKELFIGLGYSNKTFGTKRFNVELPPNAKYATMLSFGYFIIGKIQAQNKPYFKQSIKKYVKIATNLFGQKIKVIVE